MNNVSDYQNIMKVESMKLSTTDIDENLFINKNSYPINELYEYEQSQQIHNYQIKNLELYKEMYNESIKNPEQFWGNLGKTSLRWYKLFTAVYSGEFKKGNVNWFINGKINVCDNCVDRWVEKHPDKIAIIWEKDYPNDSKKISYKKLLKNTCRVANLLKYYGVKKQDTVTIYLPMIPELAYSMLACARIGAIHNVVFAGYSAKSLSDRILDCKSNILITSDFGLRGGKLTKLKQIADMAMDMCGIIKTCIVFKNKTKIINDYVTSSNNNYNLNNTNILNSDFKIKSSEVAMNNLFYSSNEFVQQIPNETLKYDKRGNSNINGIVYHNVQKLRKKNELNSIDKNNINDNQNDIINDNQNDTINDKNNINDEKNKENIHIFDENICTLKKDRDVNGTLLMKNMRPYCPIEYVDSEDLLYILYTSGSTGKPKGVAHSTSGYLLYAYATSKFIFDIKENDVFGCVADIGWVTGHTYVLYGPLLNGITTILFSSVPTYPTCSRYWDLIETHNVTQFYTAPTALRALMKYGDHWLDNYDLNSCRILGTVGEPINPETWRWYYNIVGKRKCVIVDTYWQTETGGIVIAPIPGLFYLKPGCVTLPFFGIELEILDSKTLEPLKGSNVCGLLCIKNAWPGMLRTVYGNHRRLIKTYFESCPNYYFTGDGAYRDKDGYYWITGRIDDTLNVSGHRLGAAEIEHALVQHKCIAEAAVVSFAHKVKGEGILCFVVRKKDICINYDSNIDDNILSIYKNSDNDNGNLNNIYTDAEIIQQLKLLIRQFIGPIATPDLICIVPDLPKTRSGKIIRRILRSIANGLTDFGDLTSISNFEIIELIRKKFNECKKNYVNG